MRDVLVLRTSHWVNSMPETWTVFLIQLEILPCIQTTGPSKTECPSWAERILISIHYLTSTVQENLIFHVKYNKIEIYISKYQINSCLCPLCFYWIKAVFRFKAFRLRNVQKMYSITLYNFAINFGFLVTSHQKTNTK